LNYEIDPIIVDGNGTIYFMNGSLLSKLTSDGKLSNLAGSFSWSWQDPKDGFGSEAVFDSNWRNRQSIAIDKNGNIFWDLFYSSNSNRGLPQRSELPSSTGSKHDDL